MQLFCAICFNQMSVVVTVTATVISRIGSVLVSEAAASCNRRGYVVFILMDCLLLFSICRSYIMSGFIMITFC
jgi:hypothetical protein